MVSAKYHSFNQVLDDFYVPGDRLISINEQLTLILEKIYTSPAPANTKLIMIEALYSFARMNII